MMTQGSQAHIVQVTHALGCPSPKEHLHAWVLPRPQSQRPAAQQHTQPTAHASGKDSRVLSGTPARGYGQKWEKGRDPRTSLKLLAFLNRRWTRGQ